MTISQIIACYCALQDRVEALENQADLDEQTLSIDGCDLTISNGNTVPLPITQTVYSWNITPGVNEELWSSGSGGVAHDDASAIFNNAPAAPLGLPSHPNTADITQVVPDFIDNTIESGNSGSHQFRYWGWIYIPAEGTQIQDININIGERIRIWSAPLGSSPTVVYERTNDTVGGDTGTMGPFAILNEGWHFLAFEGSDLSAFAGVQIQTDVAGNGVFSNFSGDVSSTLPIQECRQEACDYVLLPEESDCPFPAGQPSATIPAVDQDTDQQTISLTGNTLTLSPGVTGGGGTIDLSPYLDNTDSQVLAATLAGTTLNLTISNGNTVAVDLSSLDDSGTDNQLLSLVGNTLTIEDGNSVDLSAFANTDNQTLTAFGGPATGTTGISISGGNSIAITHPPVNLNTTTEIILHERYNGRSANGTTVQHTRDATMTRTGVGQWEVRFTGGTHPNGESYTASLSVEESGTLRDVPKISIVQGTQNAAGFDVQITVDDNGGAADIFADHPWSFGVEAPITVVTDVQVV